MRGLRDALRILATGVLLGFAIHFVHPAGVELFSPPPLRSGSDARYLTLLRFQEILSTGRVAVIDARTSDAFARGHIEGAWNLPAIRFESHFEAVVRYLPRESETVIYCDGPYCVLADSVRENLERLGFGNLKIFEGGWKEWVDAGLPVAKGGE